MCAFAPTPFQFRAAERMNRSGLTVDTGCRVCLVMSSGSRHFT